MAQGTPNFIIAGDIVVGHIVARHFIAEHIVTRDIVVGHIVARHFIVGHIVARHFVAGHIVTRDIITQVLLVDLFLNRQDNTDTLHPKGKLHWLLGSKVGRIS